MLSISPALVLYPPFLCVNASAAEKTEGDQPEGAGSCPLFVLYVFYVQKQAFSFCMFSSTFAFCMFCSTFSLSLSSFCICVCFTCRTAMSPMLLLLQVLLRALLRVRRRPTRFFSPLVYVSFCLISTFRIPHFRFGCFIRVESLSFVSGVLYV